MVAPSFITPTFLLWLGFTVALSGVLAWVFFVQEDKRLLLPGITTDGHHQIEQRCELCHTEEPSPGSFTTSGVTNHSCLACHKQDLVEANDSHPVIKFKNPENAVFLDHIDAMQCIVCHTEHVEDRTHEMAVSLPKDYCAHCHDVTLENIASHRDLKFDTCATAGCHNYHDNQALFPRFLVEHALEPMLNGPMHTPELDAVYRWLRETDAIAKPVSLKEADAPGGHTGDAKILNDWHDTAHARAGINCSACHNAEPGDRAWVVSPGIESCQSCHTVETRDFQRGKHGMRLAAGLTPMEPSLARLPMKPGSAHQQLNCISCHGAHRFDRQFAAAEACAQCHNDTHTQNYAASPHAALWRAEVSGTAPAGTGVSCATCHMPREERPNPSDDGNTVVVQHNQSANLRPNEKMYRSVCIQCHGLQFTMDALADSGVIDANFASASGTHHPGIVWAFESALERGDEKARARQSAALLHPTPSAAPETPPDKNDKKNP